MRNRICKPVLFLVLAGLLLGLSLLCVSALVPPFGTGPYGSYEIGKDGLELYSGSWQQAVSLLEEPDYCDPYEFTLGADMTCLSGVDVASGCRMGFVLFADEKAESYVYFTIDAWNEDASRGFQVNSVVKGQEKGIGSGGACCQSFSSVPGQTYFVSVAVEDGNVTVFVDGERLLSVLIPDENRYGTRFGLTACVGRACFDNLILDDTYLWTKDGKAGEPVPVQTETAAPAESGAETGTQPETDPPEETSVQTETQEAPDAPASSPDGSGKSSLFWPLLTGIVLVFGGVSFFVFFKIGSGKGRKGGEPDA